MGKTILLLNSVSLLLSFSFKTFPSLFFLLSEPPQLLPLFGTPLVRSQRRCHHFNDSQLSLQVFNFGANTYLTKVDTKIYFELFSLFKGKVKFPFFKKKMTSHICNRSTCLMLCKNDLYITTAQI